MSRKLEKPQTWLVSIAALTVAAAWLANFFLLRDADPTLRGTFGDMFGAVNSIFSGMAFLGVIYAIALQRYELAISKEDLERTKEIFKEQRKSLDKQNFESTFFQLLDVTMKVTNDIKAVDGNLQQVAGKAAITALLGNLRRRFDQRAGNRDSWKG